MNRPSWAVMCPEYQHPVTIHNHLVGPSLMRRLVVCELCGKELPSTFAFEAVECLEPYEPISQSNVQIVVNGVRVMQERLERPR